MKISCPACLETANLPIERPYSHCPYCGISYRKNGIDIFVLVSKSRAREARFQKLFRKYILLDGAITLLLMLAVVKFARTSDNFAMWFFIIIICWLVATILHGRRAQIKSNEKTPFVS